MGSGQSALEKDKTWAQLNFQQVSDAVKRGDQRAKTLLAFLLLSGLGGASIDHAQAVRLLQERVNNKDIDALWMLGLCYEFGMGVQQNKNTALSLYGKAGGMGMFLKNKNSRDGTTMTLESLLFFDNDNYYKS